MTQPIQHPTDEEMTAFVLDGEHTEVSEHLRDCPECTQRFQRLNAVRDSVAALPEEDVPDGLREHLLALHARKRRASPGFILSVKGSPFWFPVLAGVGTLVLLLVGVLLLLSQRGM